MSDVKVGDRFECQVDTGIWLRGDVMRIVTLDGEGRREKDQLFVPWKMAGLGNNPNWRLLPAVAAPAKADDVPVGSRWLWKAPASSALLGPFTVIATSRVHSPSSGILDIKYDTGWCSDGPPGYIIVHATRIDAPAEAAPVSKAYVQPIVYEPRQDEAWAEHQRQELAIAETMRAHDANPLRVKVRGNIAKLSARAFIGDPPDLRCTQWYGVSITDTRRK